MVQSGYPHSPLNTWEPTGPGLLAEEACKGTDPSTGGRGGLAVKREHGHSSRGGDYPGGNLESLELDHRASRNGSSER